MHMTLESLCNDIKQGIKSESQKLIGTATISKWQLQLPQEQNLPVPVVMTVVKHTASICTWHCICAGVHDGRPCFPGLLANIVVRSCTTA